MILFHCIECSWFFAFLFFFFFIPCSALLSLQTSHHPPKCRCVFDSKVFAGQLFHLKWAWKNKIPSGRPAPISRAEVPDPSIPFLFGAKTLQDYFPYQLFLLLGKSCSLSKPFLWSPSTMHLKAISKNCCWCYTYYSKPLIADVNAFLWLGMLSQDKNRQSVGISKNPLNFTHVWPLTCAQWD